MIPLVTATCQWLWYNMHNEVTREMDALITNTLIIGTPVENGNSAKRNIET